MSREKIVQLIRIKGPVVPSQLVKEIGKDTLMVSAMLSELVSNNVLKVSALKYGSSPYYLLPGQEGRLEQFSDKLGEKEKKAYLLLKEKKVLRDNILEPIIRVALRKIKDFAMPLSVKSNGNEEIFWRWFSITDTEAAELIKQVMGLVPKPAPPKPQPRPEPVSPTKPIPPPQPAPVPQPAVEKKLALPQPIPPPAPVPKPAPTPKPIQAPPKEKPAPPTHKE